jgi:hypothetical protein
MKNYKTILAAAAVGLGLSAATSQASLNINSGGTLGGLSQITSTTQNYSDISGSLDLAGTLTSAVYSGVNGLTLGGDTFVYTLAESGAPGVNDVVDSLSLTGFAGTTYSVYYITPTGSQISPAGTYNVAPSTGVITLLFNQNLTAGQGFSQIVLYDSSPTYAPNLAAVLDTLSANTADLAPAPVPEASTVMAGALMLLPLGIGAVRAIRKERTA